MSVEKQVNSHRIAQPVPGQLLGERVEFCRKQSLGCQKNKLTVFPLDETYIHIKA